MNLIETYKGVGIMTGIVCYDIRYFVTNKYFEHFRTIEEAREDIDNTIYSNKANRWINQNENYLKGIIFTNSNLIQIGKNIVSSDSEGSKLNKVAFVITDDCLDDEMKQNISVIMKRTGCTKECAINSAFQLGCKWHLKDQLEFMSKC